MKKQKIWLRIILAVLILDMIRNIIFLSFFSDNQTWAERWMVACCVNFSFDFIAFLYFFRRRKHSSPFEEFSTNFGFPTRVQLSLMKPWFWILVILFLVAVCVSLLFYFTGLKSTHFEFFRKLQFGLMLMAILLLILKPIAKRKIN